MNIMQLEGKIQIRNGCNLKETLKFTLDATQR